MRAFAELFDAIDATSSTSEKVAAMAACFAGRRDASAAWMLYFLSGQRLRRTLSVRLLARWVAEASDIPDWLFRDSYAAVGDFAETVALLTNAHGSPAIPAVTLADWVEERLASLRGMDEGQQRACVLAWLAQLERTERFLLVKLLTGSLRVGVSKGLVIKAVARAASLPETLIAERMMGAWQPGPAFLERLMSPDSAASNGATSGPRPFALASSIEELVGPGKADATTLRAALGDVGGWLLEWKWDGIRAQLVRRAGGATAIWSRGEEVLTERFPEILAAAARLPEGTVLDGEILAWREGRPLPFATMQRRIGRTALTPRTLRDCPVAMVVFDVVEAGGKDVRAMPLRARRALLEAMLGLASSERLLLSEAVLASSWEAAAGLREGARGRGVEGLMLKALGREYVAGRVRGAWWKWKIEPRTFEGVLVYAEPGHGRRAGMLTDYTLAVWDDAGDAGNTEGGAGRLVPVAKAYSGLTHAELETLDAWIRSHSTGRFGVVRAVEPSQVFEIAYEGIARSSRHRGGVAVRFPRILRWRKDKSPQQADKLSSLLALAGDVARVPEAPGLFEQS